MKPGCAFIIVWFAVIAGCGPGESARGLPQAEFDLSAYSRTVSNGITTIHIPAGVYRVSRSIELPSNTTLEGEGDSTILTAGTATFSGTRLITNDEPSRGNINIIIRAMQIRVANLPSAGYSGGLLSFSNVDGLVISGVSIVLDAPMYAVDIAARVRNTVVEGCSITNSSTTGGGGVMIRNGDPLPAPATANITIETTASHRSATNP
jgi:hypothetical protein